MGRRAVDDLRCRRLKENNGRKNVVWFGSYGINADGTAKFYNTANKHDNFGENQESVADSLTQRLSIIREELWYAIQYGLPLLSNSNRMQMDFSVTEIIEEHPDVVSIEEFNSAINGTDYSAFVRVLTSFGEIDIFV